MIGVVPSDSWRTFLEKAVEQYHHSLNRGHPVAEYLMGRGVSPESIGRFRFGVVDDPLPGHERYKGMLAIPYLSPSGKAVSLRFRNMSGLGDKYLTYPGDSARIFNTAALDRGTQGICIAEGELDAVISEQCELPTVGVPGSEAWKPIWNLFFRQYSQIIVLQDDDTAGEKFSRKIAEELPGARPIVMTGGDVTTYFLAHGRDGLRGKVIG